MVSPRLLRVLALGGKADCDRFFVVEHEPAMWDGLKGHFVEHLDKINADLKSKGLPLLGVSSQK